MGQLGKILASVGVIKAAMIMLGGKLREGLGVGLKRRKGRDPWPKPDIKARTSGDGPTCPIFHLIYVLKNPILLNRYLS